MLLRASDFEVIVLNTSNRQHSLKTLTLEQGQAEKLNILLLYKY